MGLNICPLGAGAIPRWIVSELSGRTGVAELVLQVL